ncbi:unnamed protein product [Toxocara canis]|uniref:PHYHIP_C domain-containing protein n=1 Tax=Toxocara canis TaxID=6265 RepID=A0A183U1F3_TOXCA|nr:unnamed protein product [Toxocara canis]
MNCVIPTKPGLNYEIAVRYRNSRGKLVAEGCTQIKSVFSCDELTELYRRASKWAGSGMVKLESIYRCKPRAYFDEIQKKNGGLMRTYLKDNNGHRASSINGTLKGLFFAARLKGRGYSFFGDRRLTIPVGKLITPEDTNLYFADFYCNYLQHYVTIVVCKHNSEVCNNFSPNYY